MTSAFLKAFRYTYCIGGYEAIEGDHPFMSICLTLAGTKFAVPTSLHSLMHRQRLHDLLNEGLRGPLTLLSAPAGYGKTSLLSEWLLTSHVGVSVAWVSLDASDDDSYRFWLCVFLALRRCAPDLMAPLFSLWREQGTSDIQPLLSRLINRLLEEPTARYVLVIDDYHLITVPAIHQGLTYLIERLPPQLRVVLATRVDPPLPLSRLRARGHLLEVRQEHLHCTPSEAAVFLSEVMGLSLTREEVEQITERTEGWLVGLHLIALSLQGQSRSSEALTHASGSQRYILDYLTEEVLQQQSEQCQRFLLVTSLFDEFCASLCDVLWEEDQSQQMLEKLEQRNLFVVRLDGEGVWYRYHRFFAEVLRHRLHRSMSRAQIDALYEKASVWYAEQGQGYRGYADDTLEWGKQERAVQWRKNRQHQAPLFSVFAQEREMVENQALIDPLSAREREVLELLAQGISNQEIADALVIAPNTVKRHVQVILEKLGVRNRTQAVIRAQELKLLAHKLSEAS